jgi:hypothetical protein
MEAERPNMIVHYNLDGNLVSPGSEVADGSIKVQNSAKLYSGAFVDGQLKGKMINRMVEPHLAAYTEAVVTRTDKPNLKPIAMPDLVDGFCGAMDSEQSVWNSIQGKENQITIDLKRVAEPTAITTQFLSIKDRDIVFPVSVEFQVSQDNKDYKSVTILKNDLPADPQNQRIWNATTKVEALKARYIRVIIKAESNTANDPKLLIDEVVVK